MKGKAYSIPTNHVVWVNGFKSNMPDWPTARRCAISDKLLWFAREARIVMMSIQRPGSFTDPYDQDKFARTLDGLIEVVAIAEGLSAETDHVEGPRSIPVPPGFPKPPGFV